MEPIVERRSNEPEPDRLLQVRGLCRDFREGERSRSVLRDLDLEVARGEIVALLGRSGSGKSTLLNLLSGIDYPDRGEIWMAGSHLSGMSERARTLFRRHHIGFIYQFFNLIPTLTVAENVRLPLELVGRRHDARDQAARLLAEVELADRSDTFPDRLSGGEQQRVAIARALAHQPALVLADEPTGNLDVDSAQQVLVLLQRLVRQREQTLILVTHSQEAAAIADRVLRLHGGRLASAEQTKEW